MSDILNKKGIRALPKGCACGCSYCVKCTGVGRDRRNRKTERKAWQRWHDAGNPWLHRGPSPPQLLGLGYGVDDPRHLANRIQDTQTLGDWVDVMDSEPQLQWPVEGVYDECW